MPNKKNKYGQYFTLPAIAKFMVSLISPPHSKNPKVLEPSCGKGVFLDELKNAGYSNVTAYEIDKSLDNGHAVRWQSFLSVPTTDKYDVVIGNPPYIRWKNLEEELKQELETNELWNKYFNNLCDYLYLFILKSIEHLNEGGELIFICTDYWLNTSHSSSLRDYMVDNGYIDELFHFKEAPLFEKVTASFVIFRYIKSAKKKETVKLFHSPKVGRSVDPEDLISRKVFTEETIPQFKKHSKWVLATNEVQKQIRTFELHCAKPSGDSFGTGELWRIKDICDIGNGMVSGLDKAFQIKDTSKLNATEKKNLITVRKALHLQPYVPDGSIQYMFIRDSISEEEFNRKMPHFRELLEPYRDLLEKRYDYGRELRYWEFAFPRNINLLLRDCQRIFVPCKERISNKDYFRFCLVGKDNYSTQDVTAVFLKDTCEESIEYVLAYLNNRRIFEWLKLNGVVKGEIVEFSEAPLANIPYRKIDWSNPDERKAHDCIRDEIVAYLKDGKAKHLKKVDKTFGELLDA